MSYHSVTEEEHRRIRQLVYSLLNWPVLHSLSVGQATEHAEGQIKVEAMRPNPHDCRATIKIRCDGMPIDVKWLEGIAFVTAGSGDSEPLNVIYLVDGRWSEIATKPEEIEALISCLEWAVKETETAFQQERDDAVAEYRSRCKKDQCDDEAVGGLQACVECFDAAPPKAIPVEDRHVHRKPKFW